MAQDPTDDSVREVRLEGIGLLLLGGVGLAALIGTFYLGRWYERQTMPPGAAAAGLDPLSQVVPAVVQEPADVANDADFFDRVEGTQQQLEPSREVERPPATEVQEPVPQAGSQQEVPERPSPAAPLKASAGDYWVQVFAGRDERAASGLVTRLKSAGHPVQLHTDRDGSSLLYKVRVGSFADRARAVEAARHLQADGYSGAWVTQKRPSG